MGGFGPGAPVVAGSENRTVFIRPESDPRLVVKFRPFHGQGRRVAGPQWPRYTRELFGPVPNGDLATLPDVCELLAQHGTLRIPRVVAGDDTLCLAPGPYIISEYLASETYDWVRPPLEGCAIAEIGEHMGRLHRATANRAGFGIFEEPAAYPPETW